MQASTVLGAAILSLGAALPAQVVVGNAAPPLRVSACFNAPIEFETLADLRGSAVLIEFWATWCGPCKAQIPHLQQIHADYAERGLIVLGISDEPEDKVRPFALQNDIDYAIAIDGTRRAAKDYGAVGIPHAVLVDCKGAVVWSGHPAQLDAAAIEPALVGALPLGRLQDQLEPAQLLLDRGQKGRAVAELQRQVTAGKLTATQAARATQVVARLQREAEIQIARATLSLEANHWFTAAQLLLEVEAMFAGHPHAAAAAAQIAELGKTEAGPSALELARQFGAARRLETARRFDDAYAAFRAVALAEDADARNAGVMAMARIDHRGLLGYREECGACREQKRACAEHRPH